MRRISVPPSLAPVQLAEFQDIPASLRKLLALDAPFNPQTLAFDEALAMAENALTTVRNQRERHAEALISLYTADLLWRSERWLEALELAAAASGWLKLQSSPIARYNEAIAVYFTGLLHFSLHADARALPLLMEAQSQLDESRRYWAVHAGREYFAACGRVSQWIAALVQLRGQTPPGSHTLIIPVYQYRDRAPDAAPDAASEAMVVSLDALRVRTRALDFDLLAAPDWIPLEVETLPLLDVRPGAYFFGVRVSKDEELTPHSRAGDVVLVEALSPLALTDDPALGSGLQPFTRHTDGTFMLRDPQRVGQGFVGVPRVLLRRGWRG